MTAWPASLTHNYEDPAAMTKTDTKRAVIRCFKYDRIIDTFKQELMIDTIISINDVRRGQRDSDNDE